jgi:hypothetical protein
VLRLHDPATYSYSGSGQRLPLQFVLDNIPSVRAEVLAQDGTAAITGNFLIDSGATARFGLRRPSAMHIRNFYLHRKRSKYQMWLPWEVS